MTGPCAIGLSVHTGWAACCAVAGDLHTPELLARETVEMLRDPLRFVFHRAAELKPADAARSVASARTQAARAAERALESLIARLKPRPVARFAIVARHGEMLPLDQILSAHPRIHAAEGIFFRNVLLDAAQSLGLESRVFSPRELEMKPLSFRPEGPPWGKDQKLAALAAWTALASSA